MYVKLTEVISRYSGVIVVLHLCKSLRKFLDWQYSFKLQPWFTALNCLDFATNDLASSQLRNFIKDLHKCATTIPPLFAEINSSYLTYICGTFLSAYLFLLS